MTASNIPNVWLVTCKSCNTYDIVGPGHPATRHNPETDTHEIHDRAALHARLGHKDDCPASAAGDGPVDFSFMAAPPAMQRSAS